MTIPERRRSRYRVLRRKRRDGIGFAQGLSHAVE
jgi:hypothetical protein